MKTPYLWQMVEEAVNEIGGIVSYSDIKKYISNKWGKTNSNSINDQIQVLTVNHDSRIHYGENSKPRYTNSNSKYDLLFRVERGQVVKYNQMKHGIWEIYQSSSGRAIRLCSNAYLFVWNPKIWPWDSLEKDIQYLKRNGKVSDKWSCKSHKTIKPGDRVFLAKVGSDPRGIFASGIVSSLPFLSKDRIDRSKTINCVSIDFDVLLNPEKEQILKLEILKEGNLSKQLWMSQSSGISIKHELIDELEDVWFNFLNSNKIKHNPFISSKNDNERSYNEGKSNQVIQTIYERNPAARKKCIEHYGYSCSVCNFNFENHYGEIGKNYVHVHHLKLIANADKEYEVDPIKDLRPVCPNCHAMLHKQNPPFKIEYINSLIIK